MPAKEKKSLTKTTLVDQVVGEVIEKIQAERIPSGTRLPSVREMALFRGVSPDTISKAYDKLVSLAHLEARRGSGFYVLNHRPEIEPEPINRALWVGIWSKWKDYLLRPNSLAVRLPGSGLLSTEWTNSNLLTRSFSIQRKDMDESHFKYNELSGYKPLRKQISFDLAVKGIKVDASNILTTRGATDAIHLILMASAAFNTPVLIEEPGPFVLRERLMASNTMGLSVPRMNDGPDLNEVRRLCELHRPKFFFCSSLLQNPTSSCIAPDKAFLLLKLAEEFNFMIVDDDSYGDLFAPSSNINFARMAALDQLNRVIHIGSYTKTLGAGIRVGYIAAKWEQIERLRLFKNATYIATSIIPEQIVCNLLESGEYQAHCKRLRSRLAERRPVVQEWLTKYGFQIDATSQSGMFIWANAGANVDSIKLSNSLLNKGILLAPGLLFSEVEKWNSYLRFNLSTVNDESDVKLIAEKLWRN